ncbi:SPARC-like [Physella acuta]|uniref:SPARC-like n=1 Tax=Physella acuta TaxID=109671 RepID=UPI0027DD919A|nr:SPARC-like [Physella acuta]
MRLQFLVFTLGVLVTVQANKAKTTSEDPRRSRKVATTKAKNPPAPEVKEQNPCSRKKCYRGETCQLTENREAECVCYTRCAEIYAGLEVCSNNNMTYKSECHLDLDHCLCSNNRQGCLSPGKRKIYLEYYGACRELRKCEPGAAAQFPDRMRQWLFVVMEEMAERASLGEYQALLDEAMKDESHAYASVWKFCDLDVDPQDRKVTRKELQFLTRSLKAMEHCLEPFLDGCDVNKDREITLVEWGKCLGLTNDKIKDKCLDIHKHAPKQRGSRST